MIYLIVVDHATQFGQNKKLSSKLRSYLTEKIGELEISFIGEEASSDDLTSIHITSSIVRYVAGEIGIEYRPCDPTDSERKANGILTGWEIKEKMENLKKVVKEEVSSTGKFPKEKEDEFRQEMSQNEKLREEFWYKKIEDRIKHNMIFVCAAGHISTYPSSRGEGFDTLLTKKGVSFQILPEWFVSNR